jgi:hypothetical protein
MGLLGWSVNVQKVDKSILGGGDGSRVCLSVSGKKSRCGGIGCGVGLSMITGANVVHIRGSEGRVTGNPIAERIT